MATYTADSFRNVEAENAREAALIFANRQARREFGKRGYCRSMRLDCWTEDGKSHTFEAFIGRDVERGTCAGRNEWIYVRRTAA